LTACPSERRPAAARRCREGSYLIAAIAAAPPIPAAHAQDATLPDAAAGGVRVEALVGYDHGRGDGGLLYGGRIGYDFSVGRNLLLGVDGEYSEMTTDYEIAIPGTGAPLVAEDGPELYVGARGAYVVSSSFRLFAAAGYSRARNQDFFLVNPASTGGSPIGIAGYRLDGIRLSAGAQLSLGRHAFLGAEYRYSDYGDFFRRDQLVGSIGFRF
jgi:outer membrane immunogenic protein